MKRGIEEVEITPCKKQCIEYHPPHRTRVVLNKCCGGFGLSIKGRQRLMELLNIANYDERQCTAIIDDIPRHHPALVQVVQELGEECWVTCNGHKFINRAVIVEIPVAETDYLITYDHGWEIATPKNFESNTYPTFEQKRPMYNTNYLFF